MLRFSPGIFMAAYPPLCGFQAACWLRGQAFVWLDRQLDDGRYRMRGQSPVEVHGGAFRQKESYDHWVRNTAEFYKIKTYIENNPVKASSPW